MATILCIEDEIELREDITEDLEDAGYSTFGARDGYEGLQMILEHKPDLVISDICMPRMSGHELVERLRFEHPELADMPFIFLTAYTDRKDMLDGLKLGADDYLMKPIDYDLLEIKVASALRQTGRMIERRTEQQVKLYKALASPDTDTAPAARHDLPRRTAHLVGTSDASLWQLQRQLEGLGQDVRVFTSGRSFLNHAGAETADLIFLWFHTDDMQGPMVAALCREMPARLVLVVPEDLGGTAENSRPNGVEACIRLPLSDDELVECLAEWTGA